MTLTTLIALFIKKKEKLIEKKEKDIEIPLEEEVKIFVPYGRYIGGIKTPEKGGVHIHHGNEFHWSDINTDNYVKLGGYKGTFKVTRFVDGGYNGGDFVNLKRKELPDGFQGKITMINTYENED